MAGHVKVPEGAIYVDHREVVAFVFTDHAKDKRDKNIFIDLEKEKREKHLACKRKGNKKYRK